MTDGREVPEPKGKRRILITLPTQTSLKVELYRILKRENITRAELMRRLNWKRESVDRLLRLNHADFRTIVELYALLGLPGSGCSERPSQRSKTLLGYM
jgi:hypothetical protein